MKHLLALLLLLLAITPGRAGRTVTLQSPRLTVYLPDSVAEGGNRAVIVCPGGGYTHLATAREGHDWAPFFNDLGIVCAVLEYRMPGGDREIPLADVEQSFKALTDSAATWGIAPDAIGIMGSSAGGHLAATAATHQRGVMKPAFQILFYPVISLDSAITHQGTRRGFLGENPSQQLVDQWSADKNVTPATPPAILLLSSDDKAVPPVNSINYFNALRGAGVPAAMMIYDTGGHGWGFRDTFSYHSQVLDELAAWLNRNHKKQHND